MKNWKAITAGISALLLVIVAFMSVGWNDAGKRQVVQYATGTLTCVFEPGPYAKWFGSSHEYSDVISFDFDKSEAGEKATLDQNGIAVRYRDGGLGDVYGIARYSLPNICEGDGGMLKLHKDFRSEKGLAFKIIKPYTEEVANQTAGLMTSEESYAEKRGIFTDWFRTQLTNGRYKTRMEEIVTTEPGREYCLDTELLTDDQATECASVKKTRERVPVIDDTQDNIHLDSDLKPYGVSLSGFQLQAPDYEQKTLDQISKKREATMGVITANANAERAKAQAVEAEQKGIKEVVEAKYAQEKVAAKEIVEAEKKVKLAAQTKLENEQKALAAEFYKQEQILMGEGEAERKRLVMEADGALAQKLATFEKVTIAGYQEFGKQKWVSEITMGSNGSDEGVNSAQALIDLLMVNNAKALNLDMKIKQ